MVAFVVLPVIIQYGGLHRGSNPVVVSTERYGDLTEFELHQMVLRRQRVLGILEQFFQSAAGFRTDMSRFFGPATEEDVVDSWLLAREADRLGIKVSDEAINAFIRRVTQHRLSSDEIPSILKNYGVGQVALFSMLREELKALQMRTMFSTSVMAAPPAQRWDYYQRVNRLASVELIPVPVESLVDQVADPEPAVLEQFFEDHKDQLPEPNSPEPGFRLPHRVELEYFVADIDAFIEAGGVTEEEVQEEYRLHGRDYETPALPQPGTPTTEPPAAGEPSGQGHEGPGTPTGTAPEATAPEATAPGETTREGTTPEGTPPGETAPERTTPEATAPEATAPGETTREGTTPEGTPPGETAPERTTPAPETPGEEPAAGGAPAPEGGTPGMGEGNTSPPTPMPEEPSSMRSPRRGAWGGVRLQLVSMAADDVPAAEDAVAEPDTSTEDATSDQPPAGHEQPPAGHDQPAAGAEQPATASEQPPAGAEQPPAGPDQPPAGSEQPPGAATPEAPGEGAGERSSEGAGEGAGEVPSEGASEMPGEAPVPELPQRPDEKEAVLRRIRQKLAREKIGSIYDELSGLLRPFGDDLALWEAEREQFPDAPQPQRPDFTALAKKHALSSGTTGLVSQWQLQEQEIGGAWVMETRAQVASMAVGRLLKFKPTRADDLQGRIYLFWKVQDKKARVPKYEEVRAHVLRTWKRVQARSLALQQANALAEQARKAGLSLAAAFAERPEVKVLSPKPFSWMSTWGASSTQTMPTYFVSGVEGVEAPGDEFMHAVFSLPKGGVGVAFNAPKTVAYVVRVEEFAPSEVVLWEGFQADRFARYMAASVRDRQDIMRAWRKSVRSAAGLQWQRPPVRLAER